MILVIGMALVEVWWPLVQKVVVSAWVMGATLLVVGVVVWISHRWR